MSIPFLAIALASLVGVSNSAAAENDASIPILMSAGAGNPGQPGTISENVMRLFKYLESETHVQFIATPMPWKRALVSAQKGQGVLYGASKNPERLNTLKFSEPIYFDIVWLVKRCDSTLKFQQLSDLQNKSIGVVRGSSYGEEFDRAANVIYKAELDVNNPQLRFAKLLRRRTDAVAIFSRSQNTATIEDYLNKGYASLAAKETGEMKTHPFCVLSKSVSTQSIHFAIAPGYNEEFLDRINLALIKARATGKLANIFSGRLPR